MKRFTQPKLLLIGVSLFVGCGAALAQLPVVGVYGIHYGSKVQYHYSVTNNGAYPISSVWVGYDTQNDADPYNSIFELKEYPSGMVDNNIPAASVSSPLGWAATFIGQEETLEHSIEWRMSGVGRAPINVGQTLSGISVTLDKIDSTYVTSHVTLYCWGPSAKGEQITVRLQSLDVTPPSLSLTLSPNTLPPNEKIVPVTATITVKDDYDPAPEIKLESITPNEPVERGDIRDATLGTDDRQFMLKAEREGKNKAGRSYTVIYSATDASGNQSIASARITVPHDLRGHVDHHKDGDRKDKDERGRDR